MNESLQDWSSLQLLLKLHELGSFRQAAKALNLSQPTFGRRIFALEQEFSQPLVHRTARGTSLTEAGLQLVAVASKLQGELTQVRRSIDGQAKELRGRVQVSCTEIVAAHLMGDVLCALHNTHEHLLMDLVVNNTASNLQKRESDIAVRMFQPDASSLIATKIGTTDTQFYAHKTYLRRFGRPTKMADLYQHRVVGPLKEPLFIKQALSLGVNLKALTVRTDSLTTNHELVVQGHVIGVLLSAVAKQNPNLVPLFQPLWTYPVWLVTHTDLRASATINAVWDHLITHLGPKFSGG